MLPDLQCTWLLLAMCTSLRADHLLHTLLPDLSLHAMRVATMMPSGAACSRCSARGMNIAATRRLALITTHQGGLGLQWHAR